MWNNADPEFDIDANEIVDIQSEPFSAISDSVKSVDFIKQSSTKPEDNTIEEEQMFLKNDDMKIGAEHEKDFSDTNSLCSSFPPIPGKLLYSEASWSIIAVDGAFGPNSIGALQAFLHIASDFQDEPVDGKFGLVTKKAFQKLLRRLGYYTEEIDDKFEKKSNSVKAMQTWLTHEGFIYGEFGIDGIWGANTTRQLQAFLNSARFDTQLSKYIPESSSKGSSQSSGRSSSFFHQNIGSLRSRPTESSASSESRTTISSTYYRKQRNAEDFRSEQPLSILISESGTNLSTDYSSSCSTLEGVHVQGKQTSI